MSVPTGRKGRGKSVDNPAVGSGPNTGRGGAKPGGRCGPNRGGGVMVHAAASMVLGCPPPPEGGAASMEGVLKESWRGYRMYHQAVYSLTAKGAGDKPVAVLMEMKPTCFWIGLLAVYRKPDFMKAWKLISERDVTKPVSLVEAIEMLKESNLDIPLYWHNSESGEVEELVPRKRTDRFLPGLMQVLVADDESFQPHWLPITQRKEKPFVQLGRRARMAIKQGLGLSVVKDTKPCPVATIEVADPPPIPAPENIYAVLPDEAEEIGDESWVDEDYQDAQSEPTVYDECQSERSAGGEDDDFHTAGGESESARTRSRASTISRSARGSSPAASVSSHSSSSSSSSEGGPGWPVPGPGGDAGPVPEPVAAPVRAGPAPEQRRLPFFSAAYGWTPPPCPRKLRRRKDMGMVYTRWFLGRSDETTRNAVIEEESFWTRHFIAKMYNRVIVEARKDVLIGRYLRAGDYLYERVVGEHGINSNLDATGAVKLELIDTIDCDTLKLQVGEVWQFVDGQRTYKVAKLEYLTSVGANCCTAFGFSRKAVKRVGLRDQPIVPLTLESLSKLPDDTAKVRAMYSMLKPMVPEEVKGPLNDVRNAHLAMGDECAEIEPTEVAQQMTQVFNAVLSRSANVPAWGYKKARCPRSCVSCGVEPVGKYRWKHRLCNKCREALTKRGYVTYSGSQIQENQHVPTCYPGMVYVWPEVFEPKKSKWDNVDVTSRDEVVMVGGEEVKCWYKGVGIDWRAARAKMSQDNGPNPNSTVLLHNHELPVLMALLRRQPADSKPSHCLAGIGCSGARPTVSAKVPFNAAKALIGRMFQKLPEREWGVGPKPGTWRIVEVRFKPHLLPDLDAEDMVFEDWLMSMPARRRPALRRAWEKLKQSGWTRSMRKFGSFVKVEFLPGFGKVDGDLVRLLEMLDRLINGPNDATHCIAGPIMKPKVRRLKEQWTWENIVFYGSASPESLHKWLQRLVAEEGQYFWCDFSMFDLTHSKDSWRFMESYYQLEKHPLLKNVLEAWRNPGGRIGPFEYKLGIVNASGRDDTALANGVLNGFATTLSAIASWYRVSIEDLTVEHIERARAEGIILSVCGDDTIGRLPLCSEARMAEFRAAFNVEIQKFGFVAKLCTSSCLQDAVYLGMRPYPTGKGWFWGKTIGRASYKLGWVMLNEGRDPMAHVTGIADMHTLCSRHVPVLYDLASKIVELRVGARRTPVVLDENRPWEWTFQSGVDYDDTTLKAVAECYSRSSSPGNPKDWEREVTVEDVRSLISEIRSLQRLPAVVDHWLWKHMIYADEL